MPGLNCIYLSDLCNFRVKNWGVGVATIMGVQENPFFNIYILDVFL